MKIELPFNYKKKLALKSWNTGVFLRIILQEEKDPIKSYTVYFDFHPAIFICAIDLVSSFYLKK